MAIKKIVDVGNERSALAAESHVRGAKIGDRGDAGAGGDDRAVANLESGSGGCPEIFGSEALVKNRLAMGADERDAGRRDPEAPAGGEGGFGKNSAQAKVKLTQVSRTYRLLLGDAKDLSAQQVRELERSLIE